MFPDKPSMIKRARVLWLLMAAPVIYVLVAFMSLSGSLGLGSVDAGSFQLLLLALLIVSLTDLGVVAFTQTSKRFSPLLAATDPTGGSS